LFKLSCYFSQINVYYKLYESILLIITTVPLCILCKSTKSI